MELTNPESPATPVIDDCISTHDKEIFYGLTKREAFAMAAMQNILTQYNPFEQGDFDSSNYEEVAINSVGLADALLKELAK